MSHDYSLEDFAAYLATAIDVSEGPIAVVSEGLPEDTIAQLLDALGDDRSAVVIIRENDDGSYGFRLALFEGPHENDVAESVRRRLENIDGVLTVPEDRQSLHYLSNPGTVN